MSDLDNRAAVQRLHDASESLRRAADALSAATSAWPRSSWPEPPLVAAAAAEAACAIALVAGAADAAKEFGAALAKARGETP